MATITPRKNKEGNIVSYQIEVYRGRDADGRKLKPYTMRWRVPEGWKSENKINKELDRVAAEFENECKAGNISIDRKTFSQYSEYVMKLKERDNKHRTVQRYKQLLTRINAEIGHLKLTDITGEHLNRMYMKWSQKGENKAIRKDKKERGLSNQTIVHHHRLVHAIFAQALKEGLVRYNIADTATPPKVEKKEAEFFELDDVIAIREALNKQPLKWQAITELLINTGARRGEILGLAWDNIDFKNDKIEIENNLQYTPEKGIYLETSTKNYEKRTLSIAPELINVLKAHRKEQLKQKVKLGTYWTDTGFCFTQDNGQPMNPDSINKWLREFSKEYNLPAIHPHKFRHTQASLLYAAGENPVVISKRLGHKQVSTTQNIYAHLLENGDKQASDKLISLLYKNESAESK